jgi:hypothetical protein
MTTTAAVDMSVMTALYDSDDDNRLDTHVSLDSNDDDDDELLLSDKVGLNKRDDHKEAESSRANAACDKDDPAPPLPTKKRKTREENMELLDSISKVVYYDGHDKELAWDENEGTRIVDGS